jgi:hypothetical protein
MTDGELQEQFQRCEVWKDEEQWDLLAMAYYNRGYELNAVVCFQRADACRLKESAAVLALDAVESV